MDWQVRGLVVSLGIFDDAVNESRGKKELLRECAARVVLLLCPPFLQGHPDVLTVFHDDLRQDDIGWWHVVGHDGDLATAAAGRLSLLQLLTKEPFESQLLDLSSILNDNCSMSIGAVTLKAIPSCTRRFGSKIA